MLEEKVKENQPTQTDKQNNHNVNVRNFISTNKFLLY